MSAMFLPSWGRDLSVYAVVASNIGHGHGSQALSCRIIIVERAIKGSQADAASFWRQI